MASHKNRKKAKNAFSLVFSFLLTLCFASTLLLLGCKIGIFNDRIILSQLDKTDYYDSVYEAIHENAVGLLLPSGLPEEVLDDVISAEEVRQDTSNAVLMGLKGQGYKADMRGIEERFQANIQAYIGNNKIKVNKETETGISELLEQIEKEYSRCLEFPFTKYFVRYEAAFNKLFVPALALFIVMSVIICVVLVRMQRWPHRGVRYIGYATLAASWMLLVPVLAGMISQVYKRLNVSPKYLYDLIVGVVHADLVVFLVIACVGVLLFGAEVWLISRMRHKAEHGGSHH